MKSPNSCESEPQCHWDYTGLGIQYQALAGPAFTAVFAVSGIVLGLLSDIYPRTLILGAAVIVFSLSTVLMGAATEYWHLVVLRMMYAAGYVATLEEGPQMCPKKDVLAARYNAPERVHAT